MASRGMAIGGMAFRAKNPPPWRRGIQSIWASGRSGHGRWPLAAGDAGFSRFAAHTGCWRPDRRSMLNRRASGSNGSRGSTT